MIVWKIIEEAPKYCVSNTGEVKNDISGRILALSQNERGYYIVRLVTDRGGRRITRAVHRLVAIAFLSDTRHHGDVVIHRDYDYSHNNVENLAWKPLWFAHQRANELRNPRSRSSDRKVRRQDTGVIYTIREAAVKYDALQTAILYSANAPYGNKFKAGGHFWEWAD